MKEKQSLSELLIGVAVSLGLVPIGAFLQAHTFAQLWSWFAARQYGPGPTLASWFGLSAILTVLLYAAMSSWRVSASEDVPTWKTVAKRELQLWFMYAIVLGSTWITGTLFHWIA